MTNNPQDIGSRIRAFRIAQWTSPFSMVILAIVLYFMLEPNLNVIVAGIMIGVGGFEFLLFKFLADNLESKR